MSFGLQQNPGILQIYISRNSKWVLDDLWRIAQDPIYISRNSKWVLDRGLEQEHPRIYISRNSKWVLDSIRGHRQAQSTSVEIRNEFWTNLPVGRGELSTSVEIRNEFWTHRRQLDDAVIYISRNSKWVLDRSMSGSTVSIYISRNSKWVLDQVLGSDVEYLHQ